VKKDICLSFTDYHPESWQPAWTIANILHGIVSYMPVDEEEQLAIGAIKASSSERKKIALMSHNYKCATCCQSLGEIAEKSMLEPTEEL
jgi:ubiquitin-protein ligase